MKNINFVFTFIVAFVAFSNSSWALFVAGGKISNVNVGGDGTFAVEMTYVSNGTTPECTTSPKWFYCYKTDLIDAVSFGQLLSLVLSAYTTGINVSLYGSASGCPSGTSARFTSVTTR